MHEFWTRRWISFTQKQEVPPMSSCNLQHRDGFLPSSPSTVFLAMEIIEYWAELWIPDLQKHQKFLPCRLLYLNSSYGYEIIYKCHLSHLGGKFSCLLPLLRGWKRHDSCSDDLWDYKSMRVMITRCPWMKISLCWWYIGRGKRLWWWRSFEVLRKASRI